MKKIFCYGDSWTAGNGSELNPGRGVISDKDRYSDKYSSIRKEYSWPGQIQSLVPTEYTVINKGFGGNSNYIIYRDVVSDIFNKKIKKDDIVLVCWSSVLREPLNFFYVPDNIIENRERNGFVNHSKHAISNEEIPHWTMCNDLLIGEANLELYKDFLLKRLNYYFLYEISMNYVINLQFYFEKLGIKYRFLNAFDNIIDENISFYKSIKKENWILYQYTLSEFLIDKWETMIKDKSYGLWEDDITDVERCSDGPHPNRIGYGIIADLIYNNIKNEL